MTDSLDLRPVSAPHHAQPPSSPSVPPHRPQARSTGSARRSGGGRAGSQSTRPSLRIERALQRDGHRLLAGMDEVGRGALAGPVSVGVVLIDEACRSAPTGIRDSKLLPAPRREALVAPVRRWSLGHAVGHASPEEIDAHGIIAALRLAGRRALARLATAPDLVILDGQHDWLSDPVQPGPLDALPGFESGDGLVDESPSFPQITVPPVRTIVKADRSCSSVAAASILAKVERDALLVRLAGDYPQYGWELNKGYAAPEHLAALNMHGPCPLHRRSWRLPGATRAVSATRMDGGSAGSAVIPFDE